MNAAPVSRWRERTEAGLAASLYAIPLTVTWTVAGAHIAAGLAAALPLFLGGRWRRWPVVRTRADGAFLAFAVAACLAALFALPPTSYPVPLKKLLLIPIVHLVACTLVPPQRARTALRLYVGAVALTAALASTLFLLQHHPMGDRLRSTTHYMTLSGLLVLAWPIAAAAAAHGPPRRRSGAPSPALRARDGGAHPGARAHPDPWSLAVAPGGGRRHARPHPAALALPRPRAHARELFPPAPGVPGPPAHQLRSHLHLQ